VKTKNVVRLYKVAAMPVLLLAVGHMLYIEFSSWLKGRPYDR